jgi:hypothetical protein
VMIGQRPSDVATAINGTAEDLPLADQSVDAALGVFTLQHWHSVERGLSEMSRVASDRIVLVTMDVDVLGELWLVRDYLPEVLQAHAAEFPSIDYLLGALPQAREMPLPVPRDCTDGFLAAFWGRPEAYLDPDIRAATSAWHQVPAAAAVRALAHLRRDLTAGDWDRRYGELRHRRMLDVGVRVICSEL